MKFLVGFAVVTQLFFAVANAGAVNHTSTANAVPNSYIVTVSPSSYLGRGFTSPHEELYHDLQYHGASWKVIKEYSSDVFIGAALQLDSDADLVKLAKANCVQSVLPNYIHQPPKLVSQKAVLKKRANGAIGDHLWTSTHVMTGVDKLHDEGYFGEGIKIGIIDTGVDYTHPALGGELGPGKKIVGGYDFVGDAYTGSNGPAPVPDNDPLDQCNGHGTYVAGIITASPNNPHGISGVAYKSQINAYRVYGCEGGVSDDILIEALLRADRDGNNIITLPPLGKSKGWAKSLVGVTAGKIADKGRIVIVPAGDDGRSGAWYSSGLATSPGVISVGSVDNTVNYLQNAILSNARRRKILYQSAQPLDIPKGLLIHATSRDPAVNDDACNPLPAQTPSLSDQLVLIQMGGCPLVTKFNNAAAHGARYFLVYDHQDRPLKAITASKYTAALISRQDGLFLLREAIALRYTLSFPDSPSNEPAPSGGFMSSDSSYGPSYDMNLRPDLAAPGGFILSTVPVGFGSWGIKSSTSLAASYVAGSAALLLQAKGKTANTHTSSGKSLQLSESRRQALFAKVGKAARNIFQNAADPVKESTSSSLIATAAHQGAGLLNVYNAVKSTASLLPSELFLKDTATFRGSHTVKISNKGTKPVTYKLTHVPAGTALTMRGINVNPGPVPLVNNHATVVFSHSQVTVLAGQTKSISVTFKRPTNLDATTFPVYSGYIEATGSDKTVLRSTYIGLAARLKSAKILDNTNVHLGYKLPLLMNSADRVVSPSRSATYTMNDNNTPLVVYRLVQGTPLLRISLINSGTRIATNQRRSSEIEGQHCEVPKGARLSGRAMLGCRPSSDPFDSIDILGVLSQEEHRSRHTSSKTLAGHGYSSIEISRFSNGTHVRNGSYKVLLHALKITGNPRKLEDYEVWTSPKIVINRPQN